MDTVLAPVCAVPMATDQPALARSIAATGTALASALVPMFLFGALSGQMQADVPFSDAAIGITVAVYFTAAGLGAPLGSTITQRLGARRSMLIGVCLACGASAAIGLFATNWWAVLALLALAGATIGMIDTGAAQTFAEQLPVQRQGLAFGFKEASIPTASMVAGAAVPLLALTVGWRTAFVSTLLLIGVVWAIVPAETGPVRASARSGDLALRPSRRGLVLLAVAAALAAGTTNAVATFLVPGLTAAGLTAGAGGTLLALASALGICTRIATGWLADHRYPAPQLPTLITLVLVGVVGLLLLAYSHPVTVVIGGMLTLGIGWGFTGLVYLIAVRDNMHAPAAAAGIVLLGLSLGGAIVPLLFGLVVSLAGYPAAWTMGASLMGLAALAAMAGHREAIRVLGP